MVSKLTSLPSPGHLFKSNAIIETIFCKLSRAGVYMLQTNIFYFASFRLFTAGNNGKIGKHY